MCHEEIKLRSATRQDAVGIWHLANEPAVRRNSFNSDSISLESHLVWYQQKIDSPNSRLWVVDGDGEIAANVRYDRLDDHEIEVHISVAAGYRGKGLGTKVLRLSTPLACEEFNSPRIVGMVFKENLASVRAFEKAGFRKAGYITEKGRSCICFERFCSSAGSD